MRYSDLPKSCAECGKPLGSILRPPRQLQPKAKLLILLGIILSGVLAIALGVLLALRECAFGKAFGQDDLFGMAFIQDCLRVLPVVILPFVAAVLVAGYMATAVHLNCRHCG